MAKPVALYLEIRMAKQVQGSSKYVAGSTTVHNHFLDMGDHFWRTPTSPLYLMLTVVRVLSFTQFITQSANWHRVQYLGENYWQPDPTLTLSYDAMSLYLSL